MTRTVEFPIVGIGASAGGIDAFRAFFNHLPADSGMAFVVILHLPADHKSMLTDILRHWTSMPVVDATDGIKIEANHVYVPPPHANVSLVDGHLSAETSRATDRVYHPIDGFFDSLGTAMREQAVGIVLSGTGSDGALGLKAIKERGGLTIAQGTNGTTPQYEEMPAGAIATGVVDLIVPVTEMPRHLLRLRNALIAPPAGEDTASAAETDRLAICTLLRTHLGHDFSGYRRQPFLRRVERRMAVVNAAGLKDYIAKLRADPAEIKLLFRDLLIRVTSFFRDQETFEALASKVIPQLFEGKMADATVRFWIPGCATGEEAYSVAMLLREHMDSLPAPPKVQVFATDIDDSAIATARLGRYPKTLLEGLSEDRRRRFFTLSQGIYCVTREIRDLCTFSVHNLVRDPPFSTMSLVSCRNLLIYMNPTLQARIIPVFHYALIPGGILLLGGSETVAQYADLFETVDRTARIFRRREGKSPELYLGFQQSYLSHDDWRVGNDRAQDDKNNRGPSAGASDASSTNRRSDAARGKIKYPKFEHLLRSVAPSRKIVKELQTALASTYEDLQSLTEEHQTALEELRSANEELHSVNEELQSTNEELETSKEELQSLNEELHTVNMRLSEKNDELGRANSDLSNLFDSTQIATVFLDRHLIIRSFTPAIAPIYNLIPGDIGRSLDSIRCHLKYDELREDINFVLSNLQPLERRVEHAEQPVHYIMRILPYREPDSSVTGVLITFVDVSSIVQAEEALVAADVRKDVFLATLSHELRNPLAPIRMAADLLQSPELAPDRLKNVQTILARQVTHLASLLDDLLDVSRITRGSFLLKREYVDLQVLMDDAVVAAQPAIDAKQHTLRVEYPSPPIHLEVDPVRITQVITNLLTNATKYTPSGGLIYLGTRHEARSLVIYVRDNGIGLTAEATTTVFDMFTRVKSDVGNIEGGLGIGLALAKGLIKLHGGRMEARSAGASQGSEFMIFLPRSLIVVEERPSVQETNPNNASPTAPRRILVADDNQDSAATMRMLLELAGHEVHLAHSGAEALAIANRVRPDIGILDIGMPDLSGHDVAERIRHEAWGKDVTLIAVTGWGQDADKRRSLAAGFDHHLTKPIDFEILKRMFEA